MVTYKSLFGNLEMKLQSNLNYIQNDKSNINDWTLTFLFEFAKFTRYKH